ncbi:MAG: hypothetical protein ABI867_06280 [Kofleriaceae bacterium]
MQDAALFEAAMPAGVRAALLEARRGEGELAGWLLGSGDSWGRVGDCLHLANRASVPGDLFGWLAGITMFDDPRQLVASALERPSHRDVALPHLVDAFVAGITAGLVTTGRHWASVERIAARLPVIPASVAGVLAYGLVSKHAVARATALRLAQRIGEPARRAIEAARATHDPRILDDALATLSGAAAAKPTSAVDVELLARLLEGWRATRDRELETPIARLGAELGRARGELAARSKGELEGAWLALAASHDAADVSRLLDIHWPPVWKAAAVRLAALAGFPPDPRISVAVAEAARLYDSRISQAFHVEAAALIARAPTPAVLAQLDAIEAARTDDTTVAIYAGVRRAIAESTPAAADPELLAEAHARIGGAGDLAALYDEIAANPADLEARAVLADALQLSGDPRGELIALQLADPGDPRSARRAATLLAAHGDAWTGPLPGIDRGSRRFERGFLVAARSDASTERLARSIDRPEWATVEELITTAEDLDLAPLVRRMPVLRRLGARASSWIRLIEHGPVRGVRVVICPTGWMPPEGAFPDLAVIAGGWFLDDWSADRYRGLERDAAGLGVRAITHTGFPRERLAFAAGEAAAGPPETRFAFDRVAVGLDAMGWRIRLHRDRPLVELACTNSAAHAKLRAELVASLAAAGRTELAVHLPDRLRGEGDTGGPIDLGAET